MLRPREPPPTDFIYLLDARQDSSKPLEKSLPVAKQLEKTFSVKVLVRAPASLSQFKDYQAMFEEFEKTQDGTPPLPMFFTLGMPYTETKKRLRLAIDERASLQGADRVRLLGRLVIVRDTERVNEGEGCQQLGDDIAYATWNFLGIGLLVRDGTLQELKRCIEMLTSAQ